MNIQCVKLFLCPQKATIGRKKARGIPRRNRERSVGVHVIYLQLPRGMLMILIY